MAKPNFAVLVHWNDQWHGDWYEVVDGLTYGEAEAVAEEINRHFRPVGAGVQRTKGARHLAGNFNRKREDTTDEAC